MKYEQLRNKLALALFFSETKRQGVLPLNYLRAADCALSFLATEGRLDAATRDLVSDYQDEQEGKKMDEAETDPYRALVPALIALISEISEDGYRAGWFSGIEYPLWSIVQSGVPTTLGITLVTQERIDALRLLSELIGGWVWDTEDSYAGFVGLEEWQQSHAALEAEPGGSILENQHDYDSDLGQAGSPIHWRGMTKKEKAADPTVHSALVHALASYMSEISEELFYEGWDFGLEYTLWKAVETEGESFGSHYDYFDRAELKELRALSDLLGGWVIWNEDGPVCRLFVPLAEWKAMYSRKEEPK